MKTVLIFPPAVLSIVYRTCPAQNFPGIRLVTGVPKARIYPTDATRGYDRGTRLDWSDVAAKLEYKENEARNTGFV